MWVFFFFFSFCCVFNEPFKFRDLCLWFLENFPCIILSILSSLPCSLGPVSELIFYIVHPRFMIQFSLISSCPSLCFYVLFSERSPYFNHPAFLFFSSIMILNFSEFFLNSLSACHFYIFLFWLNFLIFDRFCFWYFFFSLSFFLLYVVVCGLPYWRLFFLILYP